MSGSNVLVCIYVLVICLFFQIILVLVWLRFFLAFRSVQNWVKNLKNILENFLRSLGKYNSNKNTDDFWFHGTVSESTQFLLNFSIPSVFFNFFYKMMTSMAFFQQLALMRFKVFGKNLHTAFILIS